MEHVIEFLFTDGRYGYDDDDAEEIQATSLLHRSIASDDERSLSTILVEELAGFTYNDLGNVINIYIISLRMIINNFSFKENVAFCSVEEKLLEDKQISIEKGAGKTIRKIRLI
jgi:hypothetical protein